VSQNRSVHTDDVIAFVYDDTPPVIFQVAFQLYAKRPVVPNTVQSAVNLARLENETAPFTQADDFFHALRFRRRTHGLAHRLHGSAIVVEAFVPNAFISVGG